MRKNKIRILHVAQAAGGVDRYIRMLLKYLDKEKFENILVCSQDFHEEDYKGLLDSFEQIEMTRAIGRTDLKAIKEVRALIKKYNPDIVYIKKEYDKSIFIKNIPAPYHLEVTSYAAIGFVFYDDRNSLNRAFCAPNKIYEYSGLRIPAIGNEVPGLVNTIGAAKAGVCVPMKNDALMRAIRDIEENYDLYAKNAYDFYQGTDNEALMRRIIEENGIL